MQDVPSIKFLLIAKHAGIAESYVCKLACALRLVMQKSRQLLISPEYSLT